MRKYAFINLEVYISYQYDFCIYCSFSRVCCFQLIINFTFNFFLAEMNFGTCTKPTFTIGCCNVIYEYLYMVQFRMVMSLRVGGKILRNKILLV